MTQRANRSSTVVAIFATAAGLTACGSSSTAKSPAQPAAPAASATAPATASATPATAGQAKISVTENEYMIKPAVTSVAAGRVVFTVTNTGMIKHQFTVIRTNKPASTALSKHNPNDDIPGARGEIASIAPGRTAQLVIRNMTAGHYVFVCALPGHYQLGMSTNFTVS